MNDSSTSEETNEHSIKRIKINDASESLKDFLSCLIASKGN